MRKIFFTLLFLFFIPNFLFSIEPLRPKADTLAPQFSLLDLKGNEINLSDFKDKPVILFFWTTWCPFCRKELKVLKDIHPDLLKEGWELLVINVGESTYKVDNFLKNYALTFKVLLDQGTAVARAYDILGVPTYILIDQKGEIVFKGHYFPEDSYKDLISR